MDNIFYRLRVLKISDYILGIFVVLSLLGIFSNYLEKETLKTGNNESIITAKNIRIIILIISLIIYVYYLETTLKQRGNKVENFLNNLETLAAIFFVLAASIVLYINLQENKILNY